jgi:hypothetical protein
MAFCLLFLRDSKAACSRWFPLATRSLVPQVGNLHEVVGKHRRANPELKSFAPLGVAPLHTTEHGDAPLDPSAEALSFFEGSTLFVGLPFRRLLTTALRDADDFDAALFAGLDVLLANAAVKGSG